MRTKRIKRNIKNKVKKWLSSIEDKRVRGLVKDNIIVSGGCIASMILDEKVNDYDIYIRDLDSLRELVKYYIKKFKENPPPQFSCGSKIPIDYKIEHGRLKIIVKSVGIASSEGETGYEYFEQLDEAQSMKAEEYVEKAIINKRKKDNKEGFLPIFLTSNAITLSDRIQLVVRFYGEPEEIHKNFDFIHCMNYWDSKTDELVIKNGALESLINKELNYNGSLYPFCSIVRTRKFINRGWKINASQYLKMCYQVSKLDFSNIKVLEDQLLGVDTAYFVELIERLKKDEKERIDETYLSNLIDKLF